MPQTLRELGVGTDPRYFKTKELSSNFAVGIELEIEGNPNLDGLSSTLWNVTTDGSLRNGGREIVAKRGLSGCKLENAIQNLSETLSDADYSLSERCSTHMHLDVTDMTPKQVVNLLCISVAFEHVMFNMFGTGRGSNNFCLTTDCGTDNYSNIVASMTGGSVLRQTWGKYAAIGLYRLNDLGTVEYRMFEPLVEEDQMLRACEFLFAMKREAMSMDSPQDLINDKKLNTLEGVFHRLFTGEEFNPERADDFERGVQVLNDILTAVSVVKQVNQEKERYHVLINEARARMSEIERGI